MTTTSSSAETRLFPWLIVLIAGLALMVSNGMGVTGLSVYDGVLLEEFRWSRAELKFRDFLTLGLTGLLAPFAGIAIDRFGVRRCMFFGWVALLLAYFIYIQMSSLTGLYLAHLLISVTLIFCGLNAGVILVSHWFTRRRGTAIGLMLVGTSLGGIVFPQYGTAILSIPGWGWRNAMTLALLFPCLMLLLALFVIRDRPRAAAAPQDADAPQDAAQQPALAPTDGVDYLSALRTRTFWALAFIAMATFYTVLGMQAHLFLYMRDLGFSAQHATNTISVFFLCGLVGKFVFGFLADHLPRQKIFYVNLLVMLSGSVLFAWMQVDWIQGAVILCGFGWGGVYSMLQLSIMNCFGLRAAGKILGTITVLDALGGGLGIWLSGMLYDVTGDYRLSFGIFACLVAFSLLCLTQVRSIQQERE